MRKYRLTLLLFVLIGLNSHTPVAQDNDRINVLASVDRQKAYVGDVIEFSVVVTFDSSISIIPPLVGANLGDFSVIDYNTGENEKLEGAKRRRVLRVAIRNFKTGEYEIPALPLEYILPDSTTNTIETGAIKITIASLLDESGEQQGSRIDSLKAQAEIADEKYRKRIIFAAIAIAALVAAFLIYRRRKHAVESAEALDLRPAWEIAFSDLALLKEKRLPEKGETRLFYFELSDIIRRYVGRQFRFNAIDLTTSEIEYILDGFSIDDSFRNDLLKFLEHSDLVKFAKFVPPEEQPTDDWDQAYKLIDLGRELMPIPLSREEESAVAAPSSEPEVVYVDPMMKYAPPELRRIAEPDEEGEL